ncbi:MAG TPA: RNA polymerase sigma factor [Phycisphaerae bacterium]|nr:RNA polymerase sigma factor [Phycisphaerae bacterium]
MESDVVLLDRYLTGADPFAFTLLTRRYRSLCFSVARRLTGNFHDAEDVTQACFIELALKAKSIRGSVAGWLYLRATSRALDHVRDHRRQKSREIAAAQPDHSEEKLSWEKIEPLIDAAITALPEEIRGPIILYYLQGFSQDEIAEILQLSRATIARRIDKGLEALQADLTDKGFSVSVVTLAALLKTNAILPTSVTLNAGLAKIALLPMHRHAASATSRASKLRSALTVKACIIAPIAGILMFAGMGLPRLLRKPVLSPYAAISAAYAPYLDNADPLGLHLHMKVVACSPYAMWGAAQDIFFSWARQNTPDFINDDAAYTLCPFLSDIRDIGFRNSPQRLDGVTPAIENFSSSARAPIQLEILHASITLRMVAHESRIELPLADRQHLDSLFLSSYRHAMLSPIDDVSVAMMRADPYLGRGSHRPRDLASIVKIENKHLKLAAEGLGGGLTQILRPADDESPEIADALRQAFDTCPLLRLALNPLTRDRIPAAICGVSRQTSLASHDTEGQLVYIVLLSPNPNDLSKQIVLELIEQIPTPAERTGLIAPDPQLPAERAFRHALAFGDPPLGWGWLALNGKSFVTRVPDGQATQLKPANFHTPTQLNDLAAALGTLLGHAHSHDPHALLFADRIDALASRLTPLADQYTDFHFASFEALAADPRVRADTVAADSSLRAWLRTADAMSPQPTH